MLNCDNITRVEYLSYVLWAAVTHTSIHWDYEYEMIKGKRLPVFAKPSLVRNNEFSSSAYAELCKVLSRERITDDTLRSLDYLDSTLDPSYLLADISAVG